MVRNDTRREIGRFLEEEQGYFRAIWAGMLQRLQHARIPIRHMELLLLGPAPRIWLAHLNVLVVSGELG